MTDSAANHVRPDLRPDLHPLDALSAALATRSPATASAYLADARAFLAHSNGVMTRIAARTWLGSQEMSNVTRARKITALTALFKAAGLPDPQFKRPKLHSRIPVALSTTEALRAVEDISYLTVSAERDKALVALLYGCGLRISEALALNISDVIGDTLRLPGRNVPIMGAVREVVDAWVAVHPADASALFIGTRGDRLDRAVAARIIRQFREHAGLPETVTAKTFRHSFAIHMLEGGADVRSLQELLGHASLASTSKYMSNTERLIAAYGKSQRRV